MIPRRYVIAGLGIGLAIVLAVILRPNRSDDENQAAEPVANVSPDPSPSSFDPSSSTRIVESLPIGDSFSIEPGWV